MEGGHLKPLIVVVCERWVAIGYSYQVSFLFFSLFFLLFGQYNGAKFKNLLYLFKAIEDRLSSSSLKDSSVLVLIPFALLFFF